MRKDLRPAVLSAVLLIALALNAALPRSARADEPPPPPPDSSEPAPGESPSDPPAEPPAPPPDATEPPPAEPAATEVPTEAAPTEVAPPDSVAESDAEGSEPAEVIPELPPDTGLVVLDSEGDPLALTTSEAALILATGDPMWCPENESPGGSGCTGSFSVFDDGIGGGLLPYLQSNAGTYFGPGTIFVAATYSSLGEGGIILIDSGDGYGLTALTIQGGWDFGLNEFSGMPSTFNEALQIINWNYDVTLNDLLFDATGGSASLSVETTGNIELNNVETEFNFAGGGAVLDNTAGSGSIEINSSSFHDNLTIGIQALSNSNITLTEVDASDNNGSGAVLDNCQAAVTCGATFAGTVTIYPSTFNNNGYDGLTVSSNGYIYSFDLTANDNGQSGVSGSGAILDNSLADDPQNVLIGYQYGSQFNDNLDNGLAVRSQGDISLYDVTADGNGQVSGWAGAGAYLDNTYGNGNTYVYNFDQYTPDYGEFNDNYADGLDVRSNGTVELWYVRAENNGNSGNISPVWGMGTYIDNCNWDGFNCDGTGWVEVNGGDFNGNFSNGLHVIAAGAVELNDVVSNDNGTTGNTDPSFGLGAYIDNCILDGSDCDGSGGVTIDGGEFGSYVAGGNYGDGLHVYSSGDIYVSYVFADDNGNAGNTDPTYGNGAILDACIENAGACAGSGYVYVFASEFSGNYSDGLTAFSSSNIWLNYYVEAEENGQGLNVGVGSGAILINNFTGATGSILLYGPITLNNNYSNGLLAESNADIYMTGVDASDNGDNGAAVTTSNGSVTIDPSTFNSNDGYGLSVSATGDVALNDVEASDNGSFGASIVTTTGAVTIDPGVFNSNASYGLSVSAGDDVGLYGVEASDNTSFGASIITTAGSVSIDPGAFNSNGSFGLSVSATDDIDLTDVEANDNGSFGASLVTTSGAADIDGGDFNSNTSYGLSISADDDINLNDVKANDNGSFGASLVSANGGAGIDGGEFNSNSSYGLSVSAVDDISLADVLANDNTGFGASLVTTTGKVSIDIGSFNSNGGFGLSVSADDDVDVQDLQASDNTGFGASILTTAGGVIIGPGFLNSNGGFGLNVSATDDILLTDVQANDNGGLGATLLTTGGGVTVDPGTFNSNTGSGLAVSAADDILLTDVEADDNGGFGAALVTTGGSVSIDPGSFDGNTSFGLSVAATGDVSLAHVSASDNGSFGATISTSAGSIFIDPSHFNSNAAFGLGATASGDIRLRNVSADGNTSFGGSLTSTSGSVRIDPSSFDDNGTNGLTVTAFGSIDLDEVSASNNNTFGAGLSAGNTIDIADSFFDWNTTSFGLSATAGGDAALTDVSAVHNGGNGASISSGGSVVVDPSLFDWNNGIGLSVAATDNVELDHVTASHNTSLGAAIASGGNVDVSPGAFDSNSSTGLSIAAAGNVSLSGVGASNNGGTGASISSGGNIQVLGSTFVGNSGDGLSLSGTNIKVNCSAMTGNSGYGLNANLPGLLSTKDNDISGNTLGDVNVTGGGTWSDAPPNEDGCAVFIHAPITLSGLPWNVIHVTNADAHALNCTEFGGTVLMLPNWDHVAIPCPVSGDASLTSVAGDHLPGPLGDNYNFVSGLDIQVKPALDGTITIDFLIPPARFDSNLMILHWADGKWVDRGGLEAPDNFLEITSREGGVYVLVSQ